MLTVISHAILGGAAALALLTPMGSAEAQTPMRIMTETVRVYVNEGGFRQVDAVVIYRPASGAPKAVRAAAVGCEDGRGQIAQVNEAGAPLGNPTPWIAGGSRVADDLAMRLCQAAGLSIDLKSGGVDI